MDYEQRIEEARRAVAKEPFNTDLRWQFLDILKEINPSSDFAGYLERALSKEWDNPPTTFEQNRIVRLDLGNVKQFAAQWAGLDYLPDKVRLEYCRGFAEHAIFGLDFLNWIPPLLERIPLLHASCHRTERTDWNRTLSSLPTELTTLYSLALDGTGISDDFFEKELCSRKWENLRWLSLNYNYLSDKSVELLASVAPEKFPRLEYADFNGCDCKDPAEQVTYDWGGGMYCYSTQAGNNLEEKFGHLPWLHRTEIKDGIQTKDLNRFSLVEKLRKGEWDGS